MFKMEEFKYTIGSNSSIYLTIKDSIEETINNFRNLKDGWDYGQGSAISDFVIERSLKAYHFLKSSLLSYECTAHSDDSVQITFFYNDNFVDILVSKSKFGVVVEKGIGEDFETVLEHENLALPKIKILLNQIINQCFSLEPSISINLVGAKRDFRAASVTTRAGYQYSTRNVPSGNPGQYVITSPNIITQQLTRR
jgi:hypothetical protein